ncbi:MAG: hypothetical protein WBP59_01755 [Ilumatobacteraceae bacterium]
MADQRAVEYAQAADSWKSVDWWKLEMSGFHDAPQVRTALVFVSPRDAWKATAKRWPT